MDEREENLEKRQPTRLVKWYENPFKNIWIRAIYLEKFKEHEI